eukprot:CAMPEP_0180131530 /NCGR_PEP_ID=MMETSP0986-20121125/8471_1 /TAXON_ID=697907 /ORGANISM="non described non described, Strain CCMP2293" /LENGTH=150 /DNA_ID=CAMNT_0022071417 /DNA_START=106 /DNA_END=558 /DNA_ORIENTATION=-
MGQTSSVQRARAKDIKRVCDNRFGWLSKAGLTNTKLQRRWCAIHNLKLYYYENPRATEPKGAVDLKGAIVSISKRVKLAIEIETGVLIAEKGLEKRVYVFTTVDPELQLRTEGVTVEEARREQRRVDKNNLDKWFGWLQEETAKTFMPKY